MEKDQSDSKSDIYLSLFGCNRKLKPERIKSYALYMKPTVKSENMGNFVIASHDANEVSISFNGQSDCRVFGLDKVFDDDVSKNENCYSLTQHIIQDVIMGLNHILIVYRLASSFISKSFDAKYSALDMDSIYNITGSILKELLVHVKNEDNLDSSLHVSYFEVHDDKMMDLLKNCNELKDLKLFEINDQNSMEIQDLIEKPLVDENEISELLSKQQSHSFSCDGNCCYYVFSVTLVKKNLNSKGFEYIKIGRFILVGLAKCKNNYLVDTNENSQDWLLNFAENQECLTSPKYRIFDVLRPAFGGNAKTSIIVTLSSELYSVEKDLNILQFVSEAQKVLNYPEINMKLIIPNSLKEYSEEIQELKKDFYIISNANGVKLSSLLYRFYKNSISVGREMNKVLNNQLLLMENSINTKKEEVINLHAVVKSAEDEIMDVENSSEALNVDIGSIKSENTKQKVLVLADEILVIKQVKISNKLCIKKFKSELTKTYLFHEELTKHIQSLKGDLDSLLSHMGADHASLSSTLQLLIVDINNTLLEFETLQEKILMELDNLNEVDALIKKWKENIQSLLSKFSFFIDENNRNLTYINCTTSSSIASFDPHHDLLEKIKNNRNEKWRVLSYYFNKVQFFCDFSFKILSEIIYQLDAIESCYKSELKTIGAVLNFSSKAFKKFVHEISINLNTCQCYFDDEGKKLSEVTDLIHSHRKFKKNFDQNIVHIKQSLCTLKQMCLGHNDVTITKWNEMQKICHKTTEKHLELNELSSMIEKEMSKYLDSLAQQKMSNSLVGSPMKDKTGNIESKMHKLFQTHKELKIVIDEAFDVHQKGNAKELLEVKDFTNLQKTEIDKYICSLSSKLTTRSKSFYEELRSIQQIFTSSKDELKKSLDLLLLSINILPTIYEKYKSFSYFMQEKTSRAFTFLPTVKEDNKDIMSDLNFLIIDEGRIATSTPNITVKKILNFSHEKNKFLSRIRSIAEFQKLSNFDTELQMKDRKSQNISTMSLPNLNTHLKVCNRLEKNFSKISKI